MNRRNDDNSTELIRSDRFNSWQTTQKNIQVVLSIVIIIFFLILFILFQISPRHWLRQNSFHSIHQIDKCNEDLSGISPYTLAKGQSILFYDSNVSIDIDQPYSTCTWVPHGYTSNPKRDCPLHSQYVLTPMIPMASSSILKKNLNQAQQLIMNLTPQTQTSMIHLESLSDIHCSIKYFSCYNYKEYLTIEQVIMNLKWNSFIVKFNDISCDVTTVKGYLVVEADSSSQEKLFDFVHQLENEIDQQGVHIKIRRIEKFHLTLAAVTYTYPLDCVVDKLQQKLISKLPDQQFGLVRICCFVIQIGHNTKTNYAQDCNQNDLCVLDIH